MGKKKVSFPLEWFGQILNSSPTRDDSGRRHMQTIGNKWEYFFTISPQTMTYGNGTSESTVAGTALLPFFNRTRIISWAYR